MANHKSAAKRARQAVRKNKNNRDTISTVRTWEKKIRTAIAAADKSTAQTLMATYMSKIDRAAAKGAMHAKTAARKVSRLASRVSALAGK